MLEVNFISHTRWASVGEVNLSNTHPITDLNKDEINIAIMNGDIVNHNKIYEVLKKTKSTLTQTKNALMI